MLDVSEAAVRFCHNRTFEDFCADRMLEFATRQAMEILGEAAAKVSEETRSQLAGVAWYQIVGLRHRLAHAYFDIDLAIIWDAVKTDLPALIPLLRAALNR